MSLINQMLKDLEGRNNKIVQAETVLTGLESTDIKEKKLKKRNYLLLVASILLVLVWTWNVIHYYRSHHRSTDNLQKTTVTPTGITPQATLLTGISMQSHGKMTYFRFLLNQDIVYKVDSDPIQHSITVSLQQTKLNVNIPPLDYAGSALKELKILPDSQGNTQLIFFLKPEAKLSNLELNKESKNPELQADFLLESQEIQTPELNSFPSSSPEENKNELKKKASELSTEEQYEAAVQLGINGDLTNSIQRLKTLVLRYPEYSAARESLVTFLIQEEQREEAEDFLQAGLHLQPHYPPFIQIQARLLVDEGKVGEALSLLKKAPPALSTYPEYYAFLAALYQRQGQLSSAENLYQQLTMLHPDKGAWWLGLGITLEGLGKTAQAKEAYTRADHSLDLDPELRGYVGERLRG